MNYSKIPEMMNLLKAFALVIGGFSCAFIVYQMSFSGGDNDEVVEGLQSKDKVIDFKLTAKVLSDAFNKDEVKAIVKYDNKNVEVTGFYKKTTVLYNDEFVVSFNVGDVKCKFKKGDDIQNLKKGEKFTVVGKVTGMDFGSVYIEDCQVKN